MIKSIVLSLLILTGCSTISPDTSNEIQVVTYSHIMALANDANSALKAGTIDYELHAEIYEKLQQAMLLTDKIDKVNSLVQDVKEALK